MGMRIGFCFAVGYSNSRLLIKELSNSHADKRGSCLIDLIDDFKDLEEELNWSRLDDEHQPKEPGLYQGVVEYEQTEEDEYELYVISCTPVCYI